ncbi:hypothetical protein B0A49_05040 [Cryomyces minteri]|uniref:Metallo-beta-lactamase domain-containing protein n=1 Tax=Cryomyces minteri TaxID=331657 RepID=A0A4U0XH31_9PEZI|nr:hypothetical protein B0A49_05040 [Cryomyces minteri]
MSPSPPPAPPPSTSFTTTRLNATTFLITEDDVYGERPFIYAKLHPHHPVLVLSDSGCAAPRHPSLSLTRLRTYLETYPVPCNRGRPLNPLSGKAGSTPRAEREYLVICTHCHYDHIGALEQFAPTSTPATATATVLASSGGRKFVEEDLPTHSLCRFQEPPVPTPRYRVGYWADDNEELAYPFPARPSSAPAPTVATTAAAAAARAPTAATSAAAAAAAAATGRAGRLGITILHTPGHTPDELAWYDAAERWLYVGDSFYERGAHAMPIIFPAEGDWVAFGGSLARMLDFVRARNAEADEAEAGGRAGVGGEWVVVPRRVRIACGHATCDADAEEILHAVTALFAAILQGSVPVVESRESRGEVVDLWMEDKGEEEARFSVRAPRRLCEAARERLGLSTTA